MSLVLSSLILLEKFKFNHPKYVWCLNYSSFKLTLICVYIVEHYMFWANSLALRVNKNSRLGLGGKHFWKPLIVLKKLTLIFEETTFSTNFK